MPPSSYNCYCHDEAPVETQCGTGSKCPGCSQLSHLEKQISETRELLATLVGKREQHFTVCNTYHDTLTRRIPLEICSNVFSLSLNRDQKPELTPCFLGGICKAWRSITLSTPQLWTTLDCRFTPDMDTNAFGTMLAELLRRSGSLPLRLRVSFRGHPSEIPSTPAYEAILNTILASSFRWKELEISKRILFLLQHCGNSPLERLIVYSYSDIHTATVPIPPQLKASGNLPNPRYVDLSHLLQVPFDHVPIKWAGLVEFSGIGYDLQTCLAVFRASPLLKRFQMERMSFQSQSDISRGTIVTHSHLECLGIIPTHQLDAADFACLFLNLSLPALTTLTLDGVSSAVLTCFPQFLQRSDCKISVLKLNNIRQEMRLIEFLSLLPLLRVLDISGGSTQEITDFLSELIATSQVPSALISLPSTSSSSSSDPSSESSTAALPRFLPNLRMLSIIHDIPLDRPLLPEDKIPRLFPPENPIPGVWYRPLKSLEMRLNRRRLKKSAYSNLLSAFDAMDRLGDCSQKLKERGFDVKIYFF